MPSNWWWRFRSAWTGRTITAEQAAADPGGAVRERVEKYISIPVAELPKLRITLSDGLELKYDTHDVQPGRIVVQFSEARVQPPPHRRGGDDTAAS